jgi:hypothetical protein
MQGDLGSKLGKGAWDLEKLGKGLWGSNYSTLLYGDIPARIMATTRAILACWGLKVQYASRTYLISE